MSLDLDALLDEYAAARLAAYHEETDSADARLADARRPIAAEVARLTAERDEAQRQLAAAHKARAERLTCDISADLRKWTSGDPEFGPLLAEAADKLDSLITLLAEAERVRDEALAARERAEAVINGRGNGHALRVADELDRAKRALRDTGDALEVAEHELRCVRPELEHALAEVERLRPVETAAREAAAEIRGLRHVTPAARNLVDVLDAAPAVLPTEDTGGQA